MDRDISADFDRNKGREGYGKSVTRRNGKFLRKIKPPHPALLVFYTMEAMSKHELENGGAHLSLGYGRARTPFGLVLAANTHKGICYLEFIGEEAEDRNLIRRLFPNAKVSRLDNYFQELISCAFRSDVKACDRAKLHVRATPFQHRVWKALTEIPFGRTRTYGQVARAIGNPDSSRAVGTAVGQNPVGFLIPCHRVVRSDGEIGGYKWGAELKSRLLQWEKAKLASLH